MSVTITERERPSKSQEKPGHKKIYILIRESLNCLWQEKIDSDLQLLQLPHEVANTGISLHVYPWWDESEKNGR